MKVARLRSHVVVLKWSLSSGMWMQSHEAQKCRFYRHVDVSIGGTEMKPTQARTCCFSRHGYQPCGCSTRVRWERHVLEYSVKEAWLRSLGSDKGTLVQAWKAEKVNPKQARTSVFSSHGCALSGCTNVWRQRHGSDYSVTEPRSRSHMGVALRGT